MELRKSDAPTGTENTQLEQMFWMTLVRMLQRLNSSEQMLQLLRRATIMVLGAIEDELRMERTIPPKRLRQ